MRNGAPEPTIAQMRAFLAALDAGSVTGAAAELDLTQSAVSHSISSLERVLSVRLLKRSRAGVEPTLVGEGVALYARRILQQVEFMVQEASRERGSIEGQLTIASFRSGAAHILPPLIVELNRLHPLMNVSVQSLEGTFRGSERAVLDGTADLALVPLPVSKDLVHWEIARDEWVAICPATPEFASENLSWSVLESVPFIICNEGGAVEVRRYLAQHGRVLNTLGQVNDDSVILSMVAHGLAWSMLPRIAVEPLPDGVVVRRLPGGFERVIGLAAVRNVAETPAVAAFVSMVKDTRALHLCPVVAAGLVVPTR